MRFVNRERQVYVEDIEAREDAGTPAILGKIRTALAFRVKAELGAAQITAREHELFARALTRLGANAQIRLLGNLEAPRLAFLSFLTFTPGGRQLHPGWSCGC